MEGSAALALTQQEFSRLLTHLNNKHVQYVSKTDSNLSLEKVKLAAGAEDESRSEAHLTDVLLHGGGTTSVPDDPPGR